MTITSVRPMVKIAACPALRIASEIYYSMLAMR